MSKENTVENNQIVTLTINECSEFHSLGASYENIESVDEAIQIWKSIPEERMNGIKSIGIRVTHKDDSNEYTEMDLIMGQYLDFDMLQYYPEMCVNQKAMEIVQELKDKLPEFDVIGTIPEMSPVSGDSIDNTQMNKAKHHK